MITLAENSYGKSRVRLAKVKRHPDRHDFREWAIDILLEGDFESCFVAGDNSKILPTDTMKNTVYSLARTSSADCMEEFGKELAAFLLESNPQVSAARVSLSEKSWQHLHTNGKPHPTTFVQSSGERQTADDHSGSQRGAHGSLRSRKSHHHENIRLGICRLPKNFLDHSAGDDRSVVRHFSSRALELFVPRFTFCLFALRCSRYFVQRVCRSLEQVRPAHSVCHGGTRSRQCV